MNDIKFLTKELLKKIKKNPYKEGKNLTINQLVNLLKFASDKYYNTDKPIFSDEIYDILLDLLQSIDKNNKYFNQVEYSLEKINKVKLPYYMSSLTKIKMSQKDFLKWCDNFKGPYNLSDKIDGVSALINYENNTMQMYTRGNGNFGQNISFLIDDIKSIINLRENKIFTIKNNKIAIRGELIIYKKKVPLINKKIKNVRNTVAGIVNSKPNNYNKEIVKQMDFIAYEIMYPPLKVNEQYNLLKKIGFLIPYNINLKSLNLDTLNAMLKSRRKDAPYDIDGIVVRDNNIHKRIKNENPKYAFAFKNILSDQMAEVKVIDIKWDISKDRILVPVIIIEPVKLGGVKIGKVTGFNAKFIKENKLGPGAIVKIVRSGDVIPYINTIVKSSRNWLEPEINYEWTSTNVNIIAKFGKSKKDLYYKRKFDINLLVHFFKSLGVENLGIGIIKKLYDNKYNTIKKILDMTVKDFLSINGFQQKMAVKLVNSINKSIKKADIPLLMTATNIFGKGWSKKKISSILLVINFKKLVELYKKPEILYNKMIKIKGINEKSAKQFIKGISKFVKFISNLGINIDNL